MAPAPAGSGGASAHTAAAATSAAAVALAGAALAYWLTAKRCARGRALVPAALRRDLQAGGARDGGARGLTQRRARMGSRMRQTS